MNSNSILSNTLGGLLGGTALIAQVNISKLIPSCLLQMKINRDILFTCYLISCYDAL